MRPVAKATDKDLAVGVVSGDRHAGAELVRRYADRGHAIAFCILRNREDSEEAVQDAFIRVFRSLDRFEWKSTFATWFYRIVYNVSITAAQRRGILFSPLTDDVPMHEAVASADTHPDELAEGEELDRIVREEIEALPAASAVMLTLFLLEEQSYEEIVTITGLPLGTVKNRLHRARLQLREAVRVRYNDPTRMNDANTPSPSTGTSIDSRSGGASIMSFL